MEDRQASYRQNILELEQIVRSIQSGDVDLDVLATEVERAKRLISACRKQLRTTNEAVKRILEGIGEDPPHNDAGAKDTRMAEPMPELLSGDGKCLLKQDPEHEKVVRGRGTGHKPRAPG